MRRNLYKIAIALGGNIGESEKFFTFALDRLKAGGVRKIKLSQPLKSKPENCPPGSPDFTNAALTGEWTSSPLELLKLCQSIEIEAGRPSEHALNAPRTLDLDIILFGSEIVDLPELQIPHPRAADRGFVMKPLAEIAPEWIFPDSGETVSQIYRRLPN
ncbi:MAG: 2-amino-4-hydroxy-6-hydroxymethyldihydropteridine diphosphokinase [Victivallaceae bacterium]